jgi:hypothetical protein
MGAFLEALGDLAADSIDFAGADLLVKNSNIGRYYPASTLGNYKSIFKLNQRPLFLRVACKLLASGISDM